MLPMLGIYNVGCQNFVVGQIRLATHNSLSYEGLQIDTSRLPRESEVQEVSYNFDSEDTEDGNSDTTHSMSPRVSLCALIDIHPEIVVKSESKEENNEESGNDYVFPKEDEESVIEAMDSVSSESFNCVEELTHREDDNDKNHHQKDSNEQQAAVTETSETTKSIELRPVLSFRLSDGATQTDASVLSNIKKR